MFSSGHFGIDANTSDISIGLVSVIQGTDTTVDTRHFY